MNKTIIDREISSAYTAIQTAGIAQGNSVKKTYRSQMSTFGAAVTMGSLRAAIAFFSEKGGSDVERPKLLKAICLVLNERRESGYSFEDEEERVLKLIDYVNANEDRAREEIINAAIAIKLAMNLYKLQ